MFSPQIGHTPYRFRSNFIPFGCGRNILGGGTAGPSGDVMRDFAGEPGEYHHSRNLTKNIAVGSINLKESSSNLGVRPAWDLIIAIIPRSESAVRLGREARLAARWRIISHRH